MNLTPYEIALISGGFAIIGVLVGGIIGYYFSSRLINKQVFIKAAADFRKAFVPEIAYLKHNARLPGTGSSDLNEFLGASYISRHLSAFETFRCYLKPSEQKEFDKAWDEYCHCDVEGEPKSAFFAMYAEDKWEGQPTKELALKRINHLLSFAEIKHK